MYIWEAQKVRLDLWDETDSGTTPRPLMSGLFDNEDAAKAAILDWSGGMTKNEPTFTLGNIQGWKVREGTILWGFAIHKREVHSSHAAKAGRRARQERKDTSVNLSQNSEPASDTRGEDSSVDPSDPSKSGPTVH